MRGVAETAWVAEHLGEFGILDLRNSFSVYNEAHLPGAQYLHIETLRMSEGGVPCKMHAVPVLAAIFGQLGIGGDTPVLIYTTGPEDHLSGSYAAWSLLATGHADVRILNGGLRRWQEEARPITREFPSVHRVDYPAAFQSDLFADWRYVADRLDDPGVQLVDSRTPDGYEGQVGSTLRRGHIPGAISHNYLLDFSGQGVFRDEDELRHRYEKAGITPDKEIITYCETGREGSSVWFALKIILGYPRVRLYQASLTEWATRLDLPMVQGREPGGRKKAA
jgi:thiosulfate/3-mercaptopyruvate sulfurtransferase